MGSNKPQLLNWSPQSSAAAIALTAPHYPAGQGPSTVFDTIITSPEAALFLMVLA